MSSEKNACSFSAFSLGECPISALPLNHIFLSHAHGDHARCLLRHRSLRGMLGIKGEPIYFMPGAIVADFIELAKQDAKFEGVEMERYRPPRVIPMNGDYVLVALPNRKNLFVRAFPVKHNIPSLGYTIFERRLKLKPEYANLQGPELADLRKSGTEISDEQFHPMVTFIGDCVGESLFEEKHIWNSPLLIIEATFIAPEDRPMAASKGHTHIEEVAAAIQALKSNYLPDDIVLKHFSMKVDKKEVEEAIEKLFNAELTDRIKILL